MCFDRARSLRKRCQPMAYRVSRLFRPICIVSISDTVTYCMNSKMCQFYICRTQEKLPCLLCCHKTLMVHGQDDRYHKANNHFLQSLGLLLQFCLWDNFVSNWKLSPRSEKNYSDYKWQAITSWGAYNGLIYLGVIDYTHRLLSILSFFAKERAWKLLLESLSKAVFEWCTSSGSGFFFSWAVVLPKFSAISSL